jgi:hypothetical protein
MTISLGGRLGSALGFDPADGVDDCIEGQQR